MPLGVYTKENKDSNKLIEEFMLLANKKVAEFIGKHKDKNGEKKIMEKIKSLQKHKTSFLQSVHHN